MAHLNLTYIKENVSDDPEFIGQVLDVFLLGLEQDVPVLEQAVNSVDHDAIRKASHKVKSGFRSLGMTRMTAFLQGLEDMGKDEKPSSEIREKFEAFLSLLPEVKSEIADYQL